MKGLVFLHPANGVQDVGEVAVVAPHSLPVLVQDPLVLGAYCIPKQILDFFETGARNVNTCNSGNCALNPNIFKNFPI
jgi:hypothetical protein